MPPADEGRVVVWRLGDALLAAPLADTIEIAAVAADGLAVSRAGRLALHTPAGIRSRERPTRAVVVRVAGREVAMAAEEVLGIEPFAPAETAPLPPWLETVPASHVAGLVRLPDQRLAVLLHLDALPAS